MIASATSTFDVFVSHSAQGRAAAHTVAEFLTSAGMSVRLDQDILVPGEDWEGPLRKALVQSDAFVMIVDSGTSVAPNATFELGAAMALHKPVFVVQTDNVHAAIPEFLKQYATFPLGGIDRLVASIREVSAPLTASERETLISAYQDLGIPSDRLLADPLAIEQLRDSFRRKAGRPVSATHLASELLRLRKSAKLPRIRTNHPSG
jgi:hypothetical protein